jgi:sugar-specific transcriptional regulator TrmB
MKFLDFFTTLGYSEKDAQIWKTLYRLGTQSASVVARESGLERTYTYKTLSRLVADGLVSETEKNGVAYFFISSPDILRQMVKKRREKYSKLEDDYSLVELELSSLSERNQSILPKIQIYE